MGAEVREGMAAAAIEQDMSRQSRNRNEVALITAQLTICCPEGSTLARAVGAAGTRA